MRICVVGAGYVGLVSAAVFADWGHDVVCVDIDREKVERLQEGDLPIHENGLAELVDRNVWDGRLCFTSEFFLGLFNLELVVIAVGTPLGPDKYPDLNALWNVVNLLKQYTRGRLTVVVKSTVPPGTCAAINRYLNEDSDERFDIIYNPEFLRQGTAINDFQAPDRMVIGSQSNSAKILMAQLYESINCPFLITDWLSAEMIKHAANAFLAIKISFINMISNVCEEVGADVQQVARGIGLDQRIGPAFLKPGVGFGGSCLTKDTQALVALGEDHGVNVWLLRDALQINHEQRLRVVKELSEQLGGLEGKVIAILGLAYKANTNDVREAPSLEIISRIVQLGGEVVAYDPVVDMDALQNRISFRPAASPYEAVDGADAVVVLTEWEEFYGLDLQRIRTLLKNPVFVDGRNMFGPKVLEKHGFLIEGGLSGEKIMGVA
ncbi:MAG: UDP-glucose dehydrogenase family protein [Desulfitobacteriaceae bacterium]